MTICIRSAQSADLPAILAIYNDAVLNTTASWDYEIRTFEKHVQWFEQHQQLGLPVLVAVDEAGTITGWGSLSKFREKIGYQYTVEHSVYVASDYRRQGIARSIVLATVEAARNLGKHIIIGGVDASNEASVRLHETLGFEQVAHFKQVGYKFDRWLDLIFFQRVLTSDL
jgi:L-amino acid N-acyltransferase YncA